MTALFWDANGAAPGIGGTGTWSNSGTQWNTAADGSGATVAWNNANNDTAVFGATAGTVTVSGTVIAGAVDFNTDAYTLTGGTLTLTTAAHSIDVDGGQTATINSVLAGTVGLNKEGTGTLILTNNNSISGNTAVNDGMLQIGNNSVGVAHINSSANVTIDSDATFRWFRSDTTQLTLANTFAGAGKIRLSGAGTTDVASQWTVAAVNNSGFTGTWVLDGARFAVDSQNDLGANSTVEVQANGQLLTTGNVTYANDIIITNSSGWRDGGFRLGAIRMENNSNLSGDIQLNQTTSVINGDGTGFGAVICGYGAGTHTLSGVISGTGEFSMSRYTAWNGGVATDVDFILAGAASNTYTGKTIVDGQHARADLWLSKTGGAKAIAANTVVQFGSATGGQANLRMGADDQFGDGVVMNFVNASGQWGRFDLKGTTQTIAGLNAGTATTQGGAVIQNQGIDAVVPATNATLILNGTGTYLYNGHLRDQDNAGTVRKLNLVKDGSGTQTLKGSVINYTGATTVNDGILDFGSANVGRGAITINDGGTLLSSGANALDSVTGAITINAGGLLTKNAGPDNINGALFLNGGELAATVAGHSTFGNFVLNTSVTVGGTQTSDISADLRIGSNANRTFTVNATGDASGIDLDMQGFFSHLHGSTWGFMTKAGAGTMRFAPTSDGNIGSITVNAGKIIFDDVIQGMGNGGLANNAAVEFHMSTGVTKTFAQGMSGTGTTAKTGAGTLIFNGTKTYAGTATVDGGTLQVNGAIAAGNFIVNSGGTLAGNGGTVNSIDLNGTGILAPGASIGTLSADSGATLDAGTFAFELNNGSSIDHFNVTGGNVTLGAALDLSTAPAFSAGLHQVFALVNNTGAGSLTGTFAGIADGDVVTTSEGDIFQIKYNYNIGGTGVGNDVVLVYNQNPNASDDTYTVDENDVHMVAAPGVLGNDADPDAGDTLTASLVDGDANTPGIQANTANGNLVLNSDGSFTYTPNANFFGTESFIIYRASDAFGGGDNATITINVTEKNDAPVAVDDTNATDEDTSVGGNVLTDGVDDSDPDNSDYGQSVTGPSPGVVTDISASNDDTLSVVAGIFTSTNGATVTLNADGSYTYDPTTSATLNGLAVGATVNDTFSYTLTDGQDTDTGTVTVTVTGVNDAPTATDDTNAASDNGVAVTGNVLTDAPADSDVDDGAVLAVSNPGTYNGTYGTLTLNANGTYSYILTDESIPAGFSDNDVFNVTITDGMDNSLLTIAISGLNDAPLATDDTNAASDNGLAVTGNVLTDAPADSDVDDGAVLTVSNPGTYNGTYGTLTLNANGTYSYIVTDESIPAGFSGNDVFNVTITDGTASDGSLLTIAISGLNDAPLASDDTNAASDNGLAVTGNVLTDAPADSDVDDGAVLAVSNPGTYNGTYGTLTLNANGTYSYIVTDESIPAGFSGNDVFNVTITDGTASDGSLLTIAISGLNDAPLASDDTNAASDNGLAVTGNVLTDAPADSDVDDGAVLAVSNPGTYNGTYGTLTLNANGTYSYIVTDESIPAGFSGSDVFNVTITDGTASDGSLLTIAITGQNDAPLASDDTNAASDNGLAVTGNVLTDAPADTDVDDGAVLTVSNPGTYNGTYGTLTLNANGTYSYIVTDESIPAGFSGNDVFNVTITDGMASDSSLLTIAISGLNDAPLANDDSASTSAGVAVSGNVLANDSDPDAGDDLDATVSSGPSSGTLVFNSETGAFTYTPDSTFVGVDSFTYAISDGNGGTDTATVTITVTSAAPGSVLTIADTCEGGTALLITGTGGDDKILVAPGATSSTLAVTINGTTTTVARPSGRIIVFAGAGHDNVHIDSSISNSAWLYGEAGNDTLNAANASPGGNLILGGDGNDQLSGGNGRDIMVGGNGADKLIGNGNDDILIAGFTTKDTPSSLNHEDFWCDVLDEWTSNDSFLTRVNNLRNGNLANDTPSLVDEVFDDLDSDSVDMLQGSSGNDWFIFDKDEDKVTGQTEAGNDVE